MYHLQDFLIRIINNMNIDYRLSKKNNAIILVCCFLLVGYFVAFFSMPFKILLTKSHTINHILCTMILALLMIASVKQPLTRVKWNKALFYSMVLAGTGLVLVSFIHPIGSGYRGFGLMLMFVFPCFYFIWNNRMDYNTLYESLSLATTLIGVAYFILCIILAFGGNLSELAKGRINGTFYDANLFSMLGMVMISSSLYMMLRRSKDKYWFVFSTISHGVGICIVVLGASRLSMLVAAGSWATFIVFYIKSRRFQLNKKVDRTVVARIVIVLMVSIAFAYLAKPIYNLNQKQTLRFNKEAVLEDNNISEQDETSAIDRFKVNGRNLNDYTAGRYSIWINYAKKLNLTGNDFSKTKWKELTGIYQVHHAHNNFFEIAYRCGIPVACFHIIFELIAGIICLSFLFKKKYTNPAYYYAVVFMMTYAIQSMFDIATLPFERLSPFYFYIALLPVFRNVENEEEVV